MNDIKPYKNQVYKSLYEQHDHNHLFVDPEFPACLHSLSHKGKLDVTDKNGINILNRIEWLRPYEIFSNPCFDIDGYQRRDLGQGALGNCWFVAAAGVLTLNADLLAFVIPGKQTFHEDTYTGMFHFRFWVYGERVDVVIDDRLPCYKRELVFCRNNKHRNELWASLLEKAYAKLYGSYHALESGDITYALIDFTGGFDEIIDLTENSRIPDFKEKIKCLLQQASAKKFFVGCSIFSNKHSDAKQVKTGLVTGHAYSVTHTKELNTSNGTITLVRCLNPWNDSIEWQGEWSDNSPLWNDVSPEEIRRFKFRQAHDGEFWMSYDDFLNSFHEIQICHSAPESLELLKSTLLTTYSCQESELKWYQKLIHGKWIKDESAGGSGLNTEPQREYWKNLQYLIELKFDNDSVEKKLCKMIIQLFYKEDRQQIFDVDTQMPMKIGFDVYKIKNNVNNIDKNIREQRKFYMTDLEHVSSSKYTWYRSVSKQLMVSSGTYIIIPNTFYYNCDGDFLLRLFTKTIVDQPEPIELRVNKKNPTNSEIARPQTNVNDGSNQTDENENDDDSDQTDDDEDD